MNLPNFIFQQIDKKKRNKKKKLICHLSKLHHFPQIVFCFSHFSCDTCEATANPKTPSENQVRLLVCCLQGIHLPDRHAERDREQKTEGKQQRKAVNFLLSSSTLLTTAFFSF